ncbi:MAG: haloacid dehalogenase-like hydrolase [Planctomycetota bacterium]
MIVGLDFDNTIACYDGLFHALALEAELIPESLPRNKTAVRDFLRQQGNEDAWTELQGIGYGPRITEASPFPGAVDTIAKLADAGVETHIVSHKTKTPYRGEPHDLHAAARAFLDHHGISPKLIPADRVHLCLTKADKLARVAALNCTHFLDDLPEFLAEPAFPTTTRAVLFDPNRRYEAASETPRVTAWAEFSQRLEEAGTP